MNGVICEVTCNVTRCAKCSTANVCSECDATADVNGTVAPLLLEGTNCIACQTSCKVCSSDLFCAECNTVTDKVGPDGLCYNCPDPNCLSCSASQVC